MFFSRRFRISRVRTAADSPVSVSGSHGTCRHQTRSRASLHLCAIDYNRPRAIEILRRAPESLAILCSTPYALLSPSVPSLVFLNPRSALYIHEWRPTCHCFSEAMVDVIDLLRASETAHVLPLSPFSAMALAKTHLIPLTIAF
jgi:hypothetical protein